MNRRVLLVDDERSILLTLGEILGQHGFAVHTASCAQTAKQELLKAAFDAIVTDLHMETAGAGYDVVEAATRQIPRPAIVVISGYPDLACDWKDRGADAFLQKPALVLDLLNTLDRLLDSRVREGAA